ncbi:endonuclease domain-containing protein [Microbacterium sp. LWS13-1.2]|uniref:Endonuclease domain-containing protein n=1 Tax=Microbacterium sp. LWS13-1.2 TaxID=3135264 RepID=A0AAU6S711_9MICO
MPWLEAGTPGTASSPTCGCAAFSPDRCTCARPKVEAIDAGPVNTADLGTGPSLLEWIDQRHGVSHTSQLRVAGYTAREIADGVARGDLHRVRRSWLVRPDADERRVKAASVGGRATCLSGAEMLGLWVPDHPEVHVAVQATASRNATEGVRLHWASAPAPVSRTMTEEPVVNILFHVARCVEPRDALAVWESAIRAKKAMAATLKRVAWRSSAASEFARLASELSDSGLETRFVHGMKQVGVPVQQQVTIDGHRIDGRVGDSLLVQLDGFEFHSSAQDRRRDLEADARLVLRGYVVLRFDYFQVFFRWEYVVETILMAIAQRLHRREIR